MDYIDLYLIHWPVSSKPGIYEYPIKKQDFLPMDFKSVWAAMEECQNLGFTKSIGVSNFSCKKLEYVLAIARIPPAINQVSSLLLSVSFFSLIVLAKSRHDNQSRTASKQL